MNEEFNSGTKLLRELQEQLFIYNLEKLAKETKIPQSWLKKFRNGEIKNPKIQRVVYLWEFVNKRRLVEATCKEMELKEHRE